MDDDFDTLIGLVSGEVAADARRGYSLSVGDEELRECAYRLKDNYARFYLKFIEPSKDSIDGGAFEFGSLERLNGWNVLMGLQFENLIVNNFKSLLPKLNLARAATPGATASGTS